jgi:hypothetical protein
MAINAMEIDFVGKHPSYAINQPGLINAYALAAGVARTAIVPADAGKVIFAVDPPGMPSYVNQAAAAAIPAADVTDGSASELCPEVRKCTPGASISLIAASACMITLSYYK